MPSVLRSIFQGESFHNVYVYLLYFKYFIILFINYISINFFFFKKRLQRKKERKGIPGGVQWLGLYASTAGGTGSISG